MGMFDFKVPDLKLPDFDSLIPTPSLISPPDFKTTRIVSAIDNIQNINRLRDMDNLSFQIKLKEQQKDTCKKRLKSINATIDIKVGRILSLLIVLISVIIPFLMVAFQEILKCFQTYIFIYLIVSFTISMISMCIYLFWFWKK